MLLLVHVPPLTVLVYVGVVPIQTAEGPLMVPEDGVPSTVTGDEAVVVPQGVVDI